MAKMAAKNQRGLILKVANILFAMSLYFDQQNDPKSYFVKLAKYGGSIQNGGSKSIFFWINLGVFNIFSASLLN
jgi:hypothetical protein